VRSEWLATAGLAHISAGIDFWTYVQWDFIAHLSEYYTYIKPVTTFNTLYNPALLDFQRSRIVKHSYNKSLLSVCSLGFRKWLEGWENLMVFMVFEVLTAVVIKDSILWDITPCSPLEVNWRFGGTRRFHLRGWRISQSRKQREAGSKQGTAPSACWLGYGLTTEELRFDSREGRFFSFPQRPDRQSDHSPPSNAEVKNAWRYISSTPYVFMASY
jgi:hypothetical protein